VARDAANATSDIYPVVTNSADMLSRSAVVFRSKFKWHVAGNAVSRWYVSAVFTVTVRIRYTAANILE
jgi:hypothetical protein